jgi:hypothetical protein
MAHDEGMVTSEEELEAARGYREGLLWLREATSLETVQPRGQGSATPIGDKSFALIVEFEVSSKQVYERKYRHTIWPKEESGVTVGIGYDVGYATKIQLHADWDGAISPQMIVALERALGVTGTKAGPLARELAALVDIPFDVALQVHRKKVIPRWVAIVEGALSNTHRLPAEALGALVSLTYNRGASFSKDGDRYKEMRNIKSHMQSGEFSRIPGDLRSMKRIWPTVPGLQSRREREAKLFEAALSA